MRSGIGKIGSDLMGKVLLDGEVTDGRIATDAPRLHVMIEKKLLSKAVEFPLPVSG
jgi:hypothetical protein